MVGGGRGEGISDGETVLGDQSVYISTGERETSR